MELEYFSNFPLVSVTFWALPLSCTREDTALKDLSHRIGTVNAVRAYNIGSHRVLVLTSRLNHSVFIYAFREVVSYVFFISFRQWLYSIIFFYFVFLTE